MDWFGPNAGLGRAGRVVRWRQTGAACARVLGRGERVGRRGARACGVGRPNAACGLGWAGFRLGGFGPS